MGLLWIHLCGYVCGAALIGGLLGAFGAILQSHLLLFLPGFRILLITGIVGMLYSLKELGLVNVPAPKISRQVPAKWRLTLPPKKAALCYGLELGIGFTTYVTATTFYVVILWVILVGNSFLGALSMAAFGLGRAIPIFLLGRRRCNTGERIKLSSMLQQWKPVVHLLNGLALGFCATWFLVAGLVNH